MPTGSIKISELPELAPVPFNTDLVGVDCNTSITHKIKLTEVRDTFKVTFVQNAQTASMLQPYVLTAQTASMLQPYVLTATTASMLQPYLLIATTASMLQPYVLTAQTASMLQPYVLTVQTASMLQPYVLTASTSSMLQPYVLTTNTASMLQPYVLTSQTSSMSVANAQTASYYLETDPIYNSEKATLATTGSNTFIGEQTISGSIQISGSIIPATDGISSTSSFDLGSATNAWKDIFVSNGTIKMLDGNGNIQTTLSSTSEGLVISGALFVTDVRPQSGSIGSYTGSLEGTASYAQTASHYAETDPIYNSEKATLATTGSNTFVGNQTLSGSIYLRGGEEIATPSTITEPAGNLTIRAGDGVNNDAGDLTLKAGETTSGNGGTLTINAGLTVTGDGGDFNLSAGGTVTGAGGDITLTAGEAITGNAGDITFNAGNTVTGDGGNITFNAGTTVNGNGGDIILAAGDNDINGLPGDITLRIVSASVNKDWVFGSDGILKLNNGIGEIYSNPDNGLVRIGTAAENTAPNAQIILGGPDQTFKIVSGPPLRQWIFQNGDFNLTGSINGAYNLATTGSNTFVGQQIISGTLNVTQGITGSLLGTASWSTNALTASYALNGGETINTSSFVTNSQTGSFATTGSNTFVGQQIISGSLIVTGGITGSVNAVPTLYLLEAATTNFSDNLSGSFSASICKYSVVSNTVNVSSGWFDTSSYTFTPQKAGYWEIAAAYDIHRGSNVEAALMIRKNGLEAATIGSFGAVAQTTTKNVYLNGSTDYIDVVNVGGTELSRNQYPERSWFQAKWVGE